MKHPRGSELQITTTSEEETIRLGKHLAACVEPGMVIALTGILGSGKTTLTKGIVAGLYKGEAVKVKSPSFALVNQYEGKLPVYHIDLYRLDRPRDCEEIGIDEFLFAGGVSIIEWGEKIKRLLPHDHISIMITLGTEHERKFVVHAVDRDFLQALQRRVHA